MRSVPHAKAVPTVSRECKSGACLPPLISYLIFHLYMYSNDWLDTRRGEAGPGVCLCVVLGVGVGGAASRWRCATSAESRRPTRSTQQLPARHRGRRCSAGLELELRRRQGHKGQVPYV